MEVKGLAPDSLYHRCDPGQFSFETTAELADLTESIGQPRAVQALEFGIGIQREGYGVFALGHAGTGKQHLVSQYLERYAAHREVPADCCYVNNFQEPHKPRVLRLPAGRGRELAQDMDKLVEEAQNALKAAFENEEYQNRRQSIDQEFQDQRQRAFEELQGKAKERNLAVIRTPAGLVFAPMREGEIMPPDELHKLTEEERKRVEDEAEELQLEARRIFQRIPIWEREMREKLADLSREVANYAVGPLMEETRRKYEDMPDVVDHLKAVEKDMIDNVGNLLPQEGDQQRLIQQLQQQLGVAGTAGAYYQTESPVLRRYRVNVLVDNSESKGAPVIYEDNPTYQNLIGRVEHLPQMGTLVTDFNMMRAGALHRANGGYLVLDALQVLQQPFAWEALKRALRSQVIKIESLGQLYGVISTVSLEPEPVPLDLKVTLLGPPLLYYLLNLYDPEFGKLFKVAADFDVQMSRTPENQEAYSQLIGTVARREGLHHFDRGAVARVIEHSSRMVGDQEKLSVHMQRVTDLLQEADYWASKNGNGTITASDVQQAIDAWVYRSDRVRERMHEEIQRGTILIDTDGAKTGQVNGLSVIQLGEFSFGHPSRITARVRLGKGEVVDIEREVKMGGPIHSKGVLILSGFLGSRYAMDRPLSLSASLVFEQSYSGIEGDSASLGELCALLSAIAAVPIKQSLAVTGSVNQHGQVQPIGGVNEKVEGFFDTCKGRGLTGNHGVLIPATNVKHLMLRQDVIDAVRGGKFHIYPVETIDQGIELLTGLSAGEPDEQGKYPEDTINGKVHARLAELAEKRLKFSPTTTTEESRES